MSENKAVASNFIWRFSERCGAQIVTFIVSIVLARILAPEDYGQIALITVFITIMQVFVDSGFVNRDCGYYNVGTGVGTSLLDQIKGMVEVFGEAGKKSQIVMRPDKPNAPQYIMDITPAREELGYIPKYDYISMLKDIKREMYCAEGNEITKD